MKLIDYVLLFSIGVVIYFILLNIFTGAKAGTFDYKGSSEKFILLYNTIVPLVESGTIADLKIATNKIDILITYLKTEGDGRLIRELHAKMREKIKELK